MNKPMADTMRSSTTPKKNRHKNENDSWNKVLLILMFLLVSIACFFCSSQSALWFIDRQQVYAKIITSRSADYSQGPLLSIAPVDASAIAEESRRDFEALNSPPSEPLIGGVLVPVPLPPRPTPSPAAPTPLAVAPTPTPTLIPTSAPEPTSPPPNPQPTPVPPPPPTLPPPTAQPTAVPPTQAPPTQVPPTQAPPTQAPPTQVPPTQVPPTQIPPTSVPPTATPLPPPVISFSASTYTVNENGGSATITVLLDRGPTTDVTINYTTADGTANSSEDYMAMAGTLTFGAGQTSQTFTIPIANDTKDESDETVLLTLDNPQNGTLGSPSSATLTIVDTTPSPQVQFTSSTYTVSESGGAASITVILTSPSDFNVTVAYNTGDGTATAGSDYATTTGSLTFAPGQTSANFSVPITADTVDENDETVNLTLTAPTNATLGTPSNATLTIIDDDPRPTVQFTSATYSVVENIPSAVITVTLSGASELTVTVPYATGDDTANAGSDYTAQTGSLSFAPGQTSLNITVPITDDTLDELNETVALSLGTPTNADLGTPSNATLTIIDDDPRPTVQFTSASYSVVENVPTVDITVTLNATSELTVTAPYATGNLTASAGSDYAAQTGILSFAPGQTSLNFTVPITDDALNELDETVALSLGTLTNADPGVPVTATLTINDDDISRVEFDRPDYNVPENIGTATITVTLIPTAPTAVTVDYTTTKLTAADGTDYNTATGTLNFAPGQSVLTFTVTILDDAVEEPEETFLLELDNPTGEDTILGATTLANVNILTDATDASTCTFEPDASTDPAEPDIGPPDGEFRDIACDSAFIVDLGSSVNTTGDANYDFVYYEYGFPDPPTNTTGIRLDWVIVEVSETITGPWTQVFYWGDTNVDANSNIGAAGYDQNSSAPTTIETDNEQIPIADLFGTPPYQTGIAIDIDTIVPIGTYRYLRFSVPPGGNNDAMQIDAIEILP